MLPNNASVSYIAFSQDLVNAVESCLRYLSMHKFMDLCKDDDLLLTPHSHIQNDNP